MNMSKKTALVTGASSGIGYVFAMRLAEEGYNVTCVARGEDKLKELVEKLGDGHRYLAADLTDPDQLNTISSDVKENNYSLLINNAGYGLYGLFTDLSLEDQRNMMFLNMDALVRLSYDYLGNAKGGDALMNVSSTLSRLPYPGGAIYSGTKGFVTNFTESLWYEYKDKGIYVMALLPGLTITNFHDRALGEKKKFLSTKMGYTPEVVVKEGLKVLKARKKPSLISGPRFRRLVFILTKLMGREKMLNIMGQRNVALKNQ
ncbi:MAG: SDR family NAD(P)-dependent oxidoreductase [bacterium]|nr:SDR family NAD(P)-dependent oxidoreductase [bacterium]